MLCIDVHEEASCLGEIGVVAKEDVDASVVDDRRDSESAVPLGLPDHLSCCCVHGLHDPVALNNVQPAFRDRCRGCDRVRVAPSPYHASVLSGHGQQSTVVERKVDCGPVRDSGCGGRSSGVDLPAQLPTQVRSRFS